MRRAAVLALTLSAFALAPAAALADPPAPADPLGVVATFLELSPEQAEALAQNAQAMASSIGEAQRLAAAKSREIDALARAEKPDVALIGMAVLQLSAIRLQAQSVLDAYHQSFLDLLTPEQAEKVQVVAPAASLQPVVAAFAAMRLVEPPGGQP